MKSQAKGNLFRFLTSPHEERILCHLAPELLANLLARVVSRTFEAQAASLGESEESRQIFADLFDQARTLRSNKSVE